MLRELRRDRGVRVLVKAFADRTEVDGDTLSLQRATLVVDWLTARGVEQSASIVPTLQAFGVRKIVSSTAVRCVTTVAPLAAATHYQRR